MTLPWALPWSTLWSNFVAGATLQGAVHILDRNVVFSCGASDISSHFVRVRVARCTFWIVTWYFLVVPAAAAFQSFCVCVCACGSVRILERKKFAVAQADTPFEEESGLQC